MQHDLPSARQDRADAIRPRLEAAAATLIEVGAIGVAVEIGIPGASTVALAVGHADLEGMRPLDPAALFPIASQSKMFTAASVLLLARQGRLRLDDPVARYLPDVPAVDSNATIAQFLNHTSGIGNFITCMSVLPYPWPRFSYDDLMACARMHGRQFDAGARLDYNNTDVVVLARLCEVVSGVPRAEFLAKSIFTPLGMSDTFIGSTGEWPRERMASGYYLPSQGYEGPPIDLAGVADLTIASAAGDIISSLPDLTRWANALLTPDNPIGLSLADFTPDCAGDGGLSGPWFFPRRYARGVEAWSWGGRTVWGHRGSFFGYHSGAFVDPVSRATVSMFFSMLTAGSFLRFLDVQAPDYMGFLQACMTMAVDAVELP